MIKDFYLSISCRDCHIYGSHGMLVLSVRNTAWLHVVGIQRPSYICQHAFHCQAQKKLEAILATFIHFSAQKCILHVLRNSSLATMFQNFSWYCSHGLECFLHFFIAVLLKLNLLYRRNSFETNTASRRSLNNGVVRASHAVSFQTQRYCIWSCSHFFYAAIWRSPSLLLLLKYFFVQTKAIVHISEHLCFSNKFSSKALQMWVQPT